LLAGENQRLQSDVEVEVVAAQVKLDLATD
jgi:hypothetical protein